MVWVIKKFLVVTKSDSSTVDPEKKRKPGKIKSFARLQILHLWVKYLKNRPW